MAGCIYTFLHRHRSTHKSPCNTHAWAQRAFKKYLDLQGRGNNTLYPVGWFNLKGKIGVIENMEDLECLFTAVGIVKCVASLENCLAVSSDG